MLAQAYAERGEKQRAKETALRAFRLHPGKQEEQLIRHYTVAQQLRDRGQFAWARREFEYVIAQGGEEEQLTVMSRISWPRCSTTRARISTPPPRWRSSSQAIDAGKVTEAMLYGREAKDIRARLHYFSACHWASKNDVAKQRESLDKALEADPEDIDALIACYRLPDQPAEYHAKIVSFDQEGRGEAARSDCRRSREARHVQPVRLAGRQHGGRFRRGPEVLAEVAGVAARGRAATTTRWPTSISARGDFENAVKYQTRAAELDPHSGIIRHKLEVFRKKLEEKKKK